MDRESSVLGNAIGTGGEDAGGTSGTTASDEVGNVVDSSSSWAEGKETGAEKSLVGTDGATLSALMLAVGLMDGARMEAVTACGEPEINATLAEPSLIWRSTG